MGYSKIHMVCCLLTPILEDQVEQHGISAYSANDDPSEHSGSQPKPPPRAPQPPCQHVAGACTSSRGGGGGGEWSSCRRCWEAHGSRRGWEGGPLGEVGLGWGVAKLPARPPSSPIADRCWSRTPPSPNLSPRWQRLRAVCRAVRRSGALSGLSRTRPSSLPLSLPLGRFESNLEVALPCSLKHRVAASPLGGNLPIPAVRSS